MSAPKLVQARALQAAFSGISVKLQSIVGNEQWLTSHTSPTNNVSSLPGNVVHLNLLLQTRIIATIQNDWGTADPRSELDSHANMILFGASALIFESTGKTCNVQPFSKKLGIATNVPIVDGAIVYECPYTHKVRFIHSKNET